MADNSEGTAKKKRRGPGRPFVKGQSGNPGGRPKVTQEQRDALEAVRALAMEASEVLHLLMTDKKTPAAVRLRAVMEIFDRTYGKAEQPVKVEDSTRDVLGDIRAEVARIQGQVTNT